VRGAWRVIAPSWVGMACVRYVVRVEPLACASPETVVAAMAPTLQRYLTRPL